MRLRIALALLGCLLASGVAGAQELEARLAVGAPQSLVLLAGGREIRLQARPTGVPEEFLVPASQPGLGQVAIAFGGTLAWDGQRLVARRGERTLELALGQERVPDTPTGRVLEVPAREVDGAPHVPLSILEDALAVRLTFAAGNRVYCEPVVSEVTLDGESSSPRLVIRASAAVPFKTFRLRNPDRYVIDLLGAVLDTPALRVHHPQLGEIRLGQFQTAPAVARVVIPVVADLKIASPPARPASEFAFGLQLPGSATGTAKAVDFAVQKVTEAKVEPMMEGQRLVLTFSGPVQYEWTRLLPPDNRFVLDIPQAVLVGGRQEVPFDGPFLKSLRVSQFEAEPRPVVRAVVDMAQPADVRLVAGEAPDSLVLEIRDRAVEPTMAMLKGYGTTSFPASGGVICIDPGHGGSDPGCISHHHGVTEKEVTLDISRRLAKLLRARGWNVVLTRDDDRDVSWAGSSAREELGARVKVANDMNADVFVSIHCNASVNSGVHGTSIHAYKQSDHVLARELQGPVVAGTGRLNRGVQKDRFYVLAHSRMPAVLIETAFLSHAEEGRLLSSPEYRQKVAEGIAEGLTRYASRHIKQATAGR